MSDDVPHVSDPALSKSKPLKLLLAFAAVLLLALGFAAGSLLSQTHNGATPEATPATPSPSFQLKFTNYAEGLNAPSYIGNLGEVKLELGKVYYLSHWVDLLETGNYEWIINGSVVPVLGRAEDAGPDPFQLELVQDPADPFGISTGLQITLPDRPDYAKYTDSSGQTTISKRISWPYRDLRDPEFGGLRIIAVTTVVPAHGRTLEDYYVATQVPSRLPAGRSILISSRDLKMIAGTNTGYVLDSPYVDAPDTSKYSFVRFTNTGHGFTVCNVPEGSYQAVYIGTVSPGFLPVRTQIPVQIDCSKPV